MKPHIKPLPKTGDRDEFLIHVYGHPAGIWNKVSVMPRLKWRELAFQVAALQQEAAWSSKHER